MSRSLLIHHPNRSTTTVVINKPSTSIGRASDNEVVLVDPDRSVSRWHARIGFDGRDADVEDLQSSNGTKVNGRAIQEKTRLQPGDTIQVGKFQLEFQDKEESFDSDTTLGYDQRFDIQSGTIEIASLQQEPARLPKAADDSAIDTLKHLELLYEVGIRLSRTQSVEELVKSATELLFRIAEVHRASVILWSEEQGELVTSGVYTRDGARMDGGVPQSYDPANVIMSRTILARVRQENRPLLIRDAKSAAMLDGSASIVRAGIQAALCSPLSFQGRFLGVLYADNCADPDAFSEHDLRTFTSIAAQTGLALANALASRELVERELERQALRLYLPPKVADRIVAAGGMSHLEGTLQPVTALYADIRGFTTLSEQLEARQVVSMLSEFFTAMSGVIFQSNGTLDKFIGDCIMALFGAPEQSDDAPRHALRAAAGMQAEMLRLNQVRLARGEPEIQIGIGLHCGPAVVGNIGSADRVQYTAIGDTVNVASRLVNLAQAGQIIVSEDIRKSIPEYEGFKALGEVELKGRTGKMNVYSALWTRVPFVS